VVRTALRAAAFRAPAPRPRAALLACRDRFAGEAAECPSRFSARDTARERVLDGLRFRCRAFSLSRRACLRVRSVTCTVPASHCPWSQPFLVPNRPRFSRSASSSVTRGSICKFLVCPLIFSETDGTGGCGCLGNFRRRLMHLLRVQLTDLEKRGSRGRNAYGGHISEKGAPG
jgi:hypothetical protein